MAVTRGLLLVGGMVEKGGGGKEDARKVCLLKRNVV